MINKFVCIPKRQQTIASADFDLPNTSNEAERSFSQLKRLLTSRRTTMGEQRLNNLMGAHRSRLSEIFNAIVIEKFNGKKRMVTFAGDTVIEDDEN